MRLMTTELWVRRQSNGDSVISPKPTPTLEGPGRKVGPFPLCTTGMPCVWSESQSLTDGCSTEPYSRGQGYPSRGGICWKPEAKRGPDEQKSDRRPTIVG